MRIQFQKLKEVNYKPSGANWLAQPKLNGLAAVFYDGCLRSKTLKIFPRDRFAPLNDALKSYHGVPIYGELWHPDKTLPQISGECNHYSSGGEVDLYFVYYDAQDFGIGYARRTRQWFEHVPVTDRVFPIDQLTSRIEIEKLPDDRIDGIVYKLHGGIYIPGPAPTPNILKRKKWREADVKVLGYEPGTGENTGLVGALRCVINNVEFTVGSGLSEYQRIRYKTCLPKLVKVRYLNLSADGAPLNPIFEEELE